VLSAIDIGQGFAGKFISRLLHACPDVVELLALKSIQEQTPKTLVEVLFQARNDFFENVTLRAVRLPVEMAYSWYLSKMTPAG
jgi:hypothetical protein